MSKKGPHASNSFASLVATTANKQIKEDVAPYVEQLVIQKVAQVAGMVENNMKKFISKTLVKATALAEIAVERGLITEEELSEKIMDIEDLSWAATKTEDAAAASDVVRLVVRKKAEGQEYGLPYNVIVPSVGVGASELTKEKETELVGMKVQDKKEIAFTTYTLEVTVTRVSKRKALENGQQS